MAPRFQGESSESEDENDLELETSVFLGIPDGEIKDPSDLSDFTVSRIGGYPVFLPSRPLPLSSSHCQSCSHPMPLLVQMWCPFEESPLDRVLYVWGCGRAECQRKAGSVRAWRGLKFNRRYAAKLEREKVRSAAKIARKTMETAMKAEAEKRQSVNPFSGGRTTQVTSGLGTQLFSDPENSREKEESASGTESGEGSTEDVLEDIADQLQSTTLQSPTVSVDWSSSPSYKPIYLSTVSEYIPPPPKSKKQSQDFLDEDVETKKANQEWGLEGWETSTEVDAVFERFVWRVSHENQQCVRYDLKGTPLPFGSRDSIYNRLFQAPRPAAFTTKPGFEAPTSQRRTFNPDTLDKCETCGGPRAFECQLMPNLINVIRKQEKAFHGGRGGEEQNKARSLSKLEDKNLELDWVLKPEMEWGSCLIFSCLENCCADGDEGWKEELVLVQWDE